MRKLGPERPAAKAGRLGPRSNLVLTHEQDARVKRLVEASGKLMGEPMAPTQILRSAVSIGLVTLEQRFGLEPAGDASSTTTERPETPRHRASASTRR
jgi:hypothetical protein